jgi:hypothetical protein
MRRLRTPYLLSPRSGSSFEAVSAHPLREGEREPRPGRVKAGTDREHGKTETRTTSQRGGAQEPEAEKGEGEDEGSLALTRTAAAVPSAYGRRYVPERSR